MYTPAQVKQLAAAYKGSMAPFRQIVLDSKSREECLMKLARAYSDWKPERLMAELEGGAADLRGYRRGGSAEVATGFG